MKQKLLNKKIITFELKWEEIQINKEGRFKDNIHTFSEMVALSVYRFFPITVGGLLVEDEARGTGMLVGDAVRTVVEFVTRL